MPFETQHLASFFKSPPMAYFHKLNIKVRNWDSKQKLRKRKIPFLRATLSVLLSRLAIFYPCSFSVSLGESENRRVGRERLESSTGRHCVHLPNVRAQMNEYRSVNSLWIKQWGVGEFMMCGLLFMLMLLAQNLLTQMLRATATSQPRLC